jgi:hypothetical protein
MKNFLQLIKDILKSIKYFKELEAKNTSKNTSEI